MELSLCKQKGEEEEEGNKKNVQNPFELPTCSAYMSRQELSHTVSEAKP